MRVDIPNTVTFMKVGGEDKETESFLREWLEDVVAIEDVGKDASVLKYQQDIARIKTQIEYDSAASEYRALFVTEDLATTGRPLLLMDAYRLDVIRMRTSTSKGGVF